METQAWCLPLELDWREGPLVSSNQIELLSVTPEWKFVLHVFDNMSSIRRGIRLHGEHL